MSPRSECRGAGRSRRRQRLLVGTVLGQPGQDRRRGASEHRPQLSMMDLELPPPGLPSQQVLPRPSRSHCSTLTGAGARGSCGPGGTAATGISPSVAGARTAAATHWSRCVWGGAGWRSRDPKGREGGGGAPGGLNDKVPAVPEGDGLGVWRIHPHAWGEWRVSLRPGLPGWNAEAPSSPQCLSGSQGYRGGGGGGRRSEPARAGTSGQSGSPAWDPARMCLVTGPLVGELRSLRGWDQEPLPCRHCPPPHNCTSS